MKASGIYMIQSISKPERVYVGSAIDLKDRERCHFKDLKKGNHSNKILQNHFNKYGETDLEFSVLESGEYVGKNHLLAREQGWYIPYGYKNVDLLPYFNIAKIAGSNLGTKRSEDYCKTLLGNTRGRGNIGKSLALETIQQMVGRIPWNKGKDSIYSKEYCKKISVSNEGKHSTLKADKNTPIYQYGLDMVFIKQWGSVTKAVKELQISSGNIYRSLSGSRISAGGFIWRHTII